MKKKIAIKHQGSSVLSMIVVCVRHLPSVFWSSVIVGLAIISLLHVVSLMPVFHGTEIFASMHVRDFTPLISFVSGRHFNACQVRPGPIWGLYRKSYSCWRNF